MCLIGGNILVVVEQELAIVKLVAAAQNGVSHLGGVVESRGQSSDLTADHENMLGEEPLEEGSGLVSNAQDLDVVQTLSGSDLLLELSSKTFIILYISSSVLISGIQSIINSPNGFVDVTVDSSSKASV